MEEKAYRGWLLVLVIVTVVPSLLAGLVIRHELERRIGSPIEGRYQPKLFQTAFDLKDAKFSWKDKVAFDSGTLHVRYDLLAFLLKGGLVRVKLSGENVSVRLLGDWAASQGVVGQSQVKTFYAELGFDTKGLKEIGNVSAEAKEFQFHLKKTKNK